VALSLPEFMAGFVAEGSGIVADRDIVQRKFTSDYTYNIWNGKVMIVDRTYHPDFRSLPPVFQAGRQSSQIPRDGAGRREGRGGSVCETVLIFRLARMR
jgi:hypothetical protein